MGIPIPNISRQDVEGTSSQAGLKMFPFLSGRWTNHTAEVTAVEVMQGKQTDFLIVKGKNGEYGIRVSVQLDTDFIAHDYGQDVEKQRERNKERLLKVLAAFDLAAFKGERVELDPGRFQKAIGKAFGFSIMGAVENGRPKMNDKGYQATNVSFKGLVAAVTPVAAPDVVGETTTASCPAGASGTDYADDDIPF